MNNNEESDTSQEMKISMKEKEQPDEQLKQIILCTDVPDQKVLLGTELDEAQEGRLIQFLSNNKDVFAWSAKDLCGVS